MKYYYDLRLSWAQSIILLWFWFPCIEFSLSAGEINIFSGIKLSILPSLRAPQTIKHYLNEGEILLTSPLSGTGTLSGNGRGHEGYRCLSQRSPTLFPHALQERTPAFQMPWAQAQEALAFPWPLAYSASLPVRLPCSYVAKLSLTHGERGYIWTCHYSLLPRTLGHCQPIQKRKEPCSFPTLSVFP